MNKFFEILKGYYKQEIIDKSIMNHYMDVLNGYHDDQIEDLAKDCIRTYERFPSVAGVQKVIEKFGYKKPSSKKDNDKYSKYGDEFKSFMKEALDWHSKILLDREYIFDIYKDRERRALYTIHCRNAIDDVIGEVLEKIMQSKGDYSSYDLHDWRVLLTIGWSKGYVQKRFFTRLEEIVEGIKKGDIEYVATKKKKQQSE